ncbi:acyl-CoA dehydrogenase family protein [Sediminivirga luteola]|uniref:Acyl-CoA dehydrogenase n=1 Tax=Sediminivirga luteola TaxID=1774748 RepID=A0A8J2U019_9MICO|nr:acyl-CoA dehydrogenase family protein [Sediminivirga luteola]MCI2265149.1 acyl-CoA/acyl-ACP dehydrogenase [Sediminivirga luteola]GGA22136.1 acyl-CoA dehydrogenase [Sediminivirga luteola]
MSAFLDDELLAAIRERAPRYDRENSFFHEDLAGLRDAGYLGVLAPADLGGAGLSLSQLVTEQRRLAAAAPATALAVNMHHVWVAIALALHRQGVPAATWVLQEAAAGKLFAFGFSEPGNNAVPLVSLTRADADGQGGYRFTGTKVFTSLSPAWDHLGLFGTDGADPEQPSIVYGFVSRKQPGYEIREDWDTLGQRATQSNTTTLDGVHVPPARLLWRAIPGEHDALTQALSFSFATLIASVYTGIGDRALDLAAREAAGASPKVLDRGAAREENPYVRQHLAQAFIALDGVRAQLELLALRYDEAVLGAPASTETGADPAGEPLIGRQLAGRSLGLKIRATETAREVVDHALRLAGGGAFASGHELSRLYRDVLAGIFHPADYQAAENSLAEALLAPHRRDPAS